MVVAELKNNNYHVLPLYLLRFPFLAQQVAARVVQMRDFLTVSSSLCSLLYSNIHLITTSPPRVYISFEYMNNRHDYPHSVFTIQDMLY